MEFGIFLCLGDKVCHPEERRIFARNSTIKIKSAKKQNR